MSAVKRLVTHAAPMMVAPMVPLAASFVLVATALALGRADFAVVFGALATVSGLATLITAGVAIGALRELADAGDDPRRVAEAVQANLRTASAVSVIVTVVAVVATVAMWFVLPADSAVRAALIVGAVCSLPGLWVTPHTSVLTSVLQHHDHERANLTIIVTRTLVRLGVGLVVLLSVADVMWAIALDAVVASALGVMALRARWQRVRDRVAGVRLIATAEFRWRTLGDRVANSLDGAVFMVAFLLAQTVAASVSVEVGAQVAAGVAFCRTVILPLKMVGITVGRMHRRESGAGFAAASFGVTLLIVVPVSLALVMLGLGGVSPFGQVALSYLIAAQLLVEPFAGVLYSYLKVVCGARAGMIGLLGAYLVLAPMLLLLARGVWPSAEGIWVALLGVRLVFATTSLLALRRAR